MFQEVDKFIYELGLKETNCEKQRKIAALALNEEEWCNATAGVIVRRASGVLGLRRVKPYQGFSSVMHKYQVEPCSRLV